MDLRAEKNKLELVIASSNLFSQRTNDQLIQKQFIASQKLADDRDR